MFDWVMEMKWKLSKQDAEKLLEIADLVGRAQTIREIRFYKKEVYKILQAAKDRQDQTRMKAISTT